MTKYCYSERVSVYINKNCKYLFIEVTLKLHATYRLVICTITLYDQEGNCKRSVLSTYAKYLLWYLLRSLYACLLRRIY